MEGVVGCFIAAVLFVLGALVGLSASQSSWEKDCTEIGMHREDGRVFKCEPVKKEK